MIPCPDCGGTGIAHCCEGVCATRSGATQRNSGMSVPAHAVTRTVMVRGDTQIEILAQGEGPLAVLLPSLGRGAAVDEIAGRLADAGLWVPRPEPRGSGRAAVQ
jgi:hypothetical protein